MPQGELAGLQVLRSDTDRANAAFLTVPGLANSACLSFESASRRGYFLRHQGFVLKLHAPDGSQLFREDATFCPKPGVADPLYWSLESLNYPGYFLQSRNGGWVIDLLNTDINARANATLRRVVIECCRFYGAIDARAGWVDTGLDVTTANSVTIRQVGGGWSVDGRRYARVGGNGHRDEARTDLRNWLHLKAFPRAHFGSLIGAINRSDLFLVGADYRNMAPSNGRLYLRINDVDQSLGDNQGALTVEVLVE
jgi:hypothetical protein